MLLITAYTNAYQSNIRKVIRGARALRLAFFCVGATAAKKNVLKNNIESKEIKKTFNLLFIKTK